MPPGRRPSVPVDQVLDLMLQGMTEKAAADRLSLPAGRVRTALRKARYKRGFPTVPVMLAARKVETSGD